VSLDDLKSQFISVAAHELRTPLTSLLGFVELLLEDQPAGVSARQTQFLEMINRSSQRLLSLTNNLLDITRMDADRIELHLQETDPLKLVERVANELQPLFNAHHQLLLLSAVQNLPHILCDRTRAHQILVNLLGNANKYSPDGATVSVDIALEEDQHFLRFAVKDSGIGIPLADHSKLFDRFFRASNARVDGIAGAGLGLSITRSLVEMHGGRIWFDSAAGAGSTFYVTFPVVSD
jgi:signal transduction histidine kinase